jgi:hypothetical protein
VERDLGEEQQVVVRWEAELVALVVAEVIVVEAEVIVVEAEVVVVEAEVVVVEAEVALEAEMVHLTVSNLYSSLRCYQIRETKY